MCVEPVVGAWQYSYSHSGTAHLNCITGLCILFYGSSCLLILHSFRTIDFNEFYVDSHVISEGFNNNATPAKVPNRRHLSDVSRRTRVRVPRD